MNALHTAHAGYRQEPNLLINPFFRFDQRNASLVGSPITGAGGSTGTYRMDRWVQYDDSTDTRSIYRNLFTVGQTEVPGNPRHHFRWAISSLAGSPTIKALGQRVEDVTALAGERIGFGVWLKSSVAMTVTVKAIQNFGTGGSPSGPGTRTLGTFSVQTFWKWFDLSYILPGVSGKVLGTNGNDYTEIRMELPLATQFTFDVSNAALTRTVARQAHEIARTRNAELAECFRFYNKTFPLEIPAAANQAVTGGVVIRDVAGNTEEVEQWEFPRMRSTPTATRISPTGASGTDWSTGSGSRVSSLIATSDRSISVATTGAGASGYWYLHLTAEAEL